MRVLVTGGSGFVGRALTNALAAQPNIEVRTTVRHEGFGNGHAVTDVVVAELSSETVWGKALAGVGVVVHTAARVHMMNDTVVDPLAAFRAVNVDATLNLAKQAALAGVERFVFLSSVKVNGEGTQSGKLYTVDDPLAPEDPYAFSKAEAENGLKLLAQETGLEVVIIRPTLVYGPGVKGNFSTLLSWLQLGVPLPLGLATKNRRSMVALDNLVDLLLTCIDHPAAANKTFLVSDGEDLSTTELLRRLGNAMGIRTRLLPVPPALLQAAAIVLGKGDMVQRLIGNLQVDITHTCQTLGWKPPLSIDEGLRRAVWDSYK